MADVYFPFYPGDYLRDTGGLTLGEHGAYLLLMAHYYASDGKIPSEKRRIYRLCRAVEKEEQTAVDNVIDIFFPIKNGKITNKRADIEIEKRRLFLAEQARKSALAVAARNKPTDSPTGKPIDQPTDQPAGIPYPSPSPSLTPSPKPKKEHGRFTPPTLSEVKNYCNERGNNIDPQYFIDKNTSIGWVVGKNRTPMKCWKATIRTWEKFSMNPEDKAKKCQCGKPATFQVGNEPKCQKCFQEQK